MFHVLLPSSLYSYLAGSKVSTKSDCKTQYFDMCKSPNTVHIIFTDKSLSHQTPQKEADIFMIVHTWHAVYNLHWKLWKTLKWPTYTQLSLLLGFFKSSIHAYFPVKCSSKKNKTKNTIDSDVKYSYICTYLRTFCFHIGLFLPFYFTISFGLLKNQRL